MPSVEQTIQDILQAPTWNKRVAQIRLVSQRHGTAAHTQIWAEVAREGYVPHLAPDFAYIHPASFYGAAYFREVYGIAEAATAGFTEVSAQRLAEILIEDPRVLLVLRTMVGLTKDEFAHSTTLVGHSEAHPALSSGKIDAMERRGIATTDEQAEVAARTLSTIMDGSLFPAPEGGLRSKQAKLDTADGWWSVQRFASTGVPYADFLHQRHYGGAFRQVLDATSSRRGDLIEDAVETLFTDAGIPHIRTGSHNQNDIAERFEIQSPQPRTSSCSTAATASGRCSNARSPTTVAPPATRPFASRGYAQSPYGSAASRYSLSSVAWAGHESTTPWGQSPATPTAACSRWPPCPRCSTSPPFPPCVASPSSCPGGQSIRAEPSSEPAAGCPGRVLISPNGGGDPPRGGTRGGSRGAGAAAGGRSRAARIDGSRSVRLVEPIEYSGPSRWSGTAQGTVSDSRLSMLPVAVARMP